MSRPPGLYQREEQIARHFPGLSRPAVLGLALWGPGMVVVRSCSLTAVADGWSCRLGQRLNTVRERLRDTCREADAKAGGVGANWAWACAGRPGSPLPAVALDATGLGSRFVALVASVPYRGCAVPVACHPIGPRRGQPLERARAIGAKATKPLGGF